MKKIFFILMAFAMLSSCKKEQKITVAANITAPVISSPTDGTAIAVTAADSSQTLNIKWSKPDYGVSAVVSYFVQVDSLGNSFKKYVTLGNLTTTTSLSLSYGTLNGLLLGGLNLNPNVATTVEFRVGSAIYGADTVYSKVVKVAVTTLQPNQLWLPGSYENYTPATAQIIPALLTNPTSYEGYVYFSAAGNFKFTPTPAYGPVIYGDGGNGALAKSSNPNAIVYNNAGVYLIDADITALTYSATYISTFGIIGTATPQAWNASTPMTYNPATGLWTVSVALVPGALKFRANDAWDINYGPSNANALAGTLIFNDPGAVTITDAGTYTVTLDMTKSTQKAYAYTIVKN
ncbi:uncharacterized protein DUF5019 [Mucilaginibacter frigoritolerans]|uniref:Uncharacterized protein DUF5019 n=1 Tax=Mucilaginibacter frigoritolerans TaxID=652788 RepID=A0A562TR76_9SPHI|nr:SusE domain-containing protein [Mucilaginibacter frigoritolerans]TWI95576.1 uncharacterized protein DUF5019 [Mucilaginibacter frigoritolerans]